MDVGSGDRGRRRFRLGASLAALAAVGIAATADGASSSCNPAGSVTVARSADGRLFTSRSGALYGCLFAAPRPLFLASGTLPVGTPRTRGPFAAFVRPAHHDGATDEDVRATLYSIGLCRRDARRFKYVAPAGEATLGKNPVSDLVLSRYGDVAWIARPAHAGGFYAVMKLDATTNPRAPRVLAFSRDVSPRSLRISGTRISWREGGRPVSGRLKPRVASCRP
jgi:hypothetical protein